ncbi:MAG: phosphatidate cytidylyltransferase [Clostridiaceae bacterium]|nr:phosphatidate cytidylyltransferase [Clostridiaceae bacterium]
MDFKRISSALIGFPLVAIIIIFGNKYIIDICFSIIAIMALHEYFHSFKEQNQNRDLRWIAYVAALSISCIHIIPSGYALRAIAAIIPISILVLFAQVIATNMKYNIKDIAITFFGICYIVIFLMYIPIIRQMENGIIIVWYLFFASWGTDIFAYLIGKRFGKHKFSQISPNKSLEGCIAGTIGAIFIMLGYTWICNTYFGMNFNYCYIIIISVVLSLVGQLGDLAASSIKRYTGIKDFSNLIPGHGGMLDRIDSVIFIAPFAYFLFMLL